MNPGSFSYDVSVEVTLTGMDLLALFDGADKHYDARCRMMASPALNAGPWVTSVGGEVWGLVVEFIRSRDEKLPGETFLNMFRRVALADPGRTVTRALPGRTLDLFCKCLEHPADAAGMDLFFALRTAHASIRREHQRLAFQARLRRALDAFGWGPRDTALASGESIRFRLEIQGWTLGNGTVTTPWAGKAVPADPEVALRDIEASLEDDPVDDSEFSPSGRS